MKAYASEGQVVNAGMQDPLLDSQDTLESYVLWKTQGWADFAEANYYTQWDEFYRLWRGQCFNNLIESSKKHRNQCQY